MSGELIVRVAFRAEEGERVCDESFRLVAGNRRCWRPKGHEGPHFADLTHGDVVVWERKADLT